MRTQVNCRVSQLKHFFKWIPRQANGNASRDYDRSVQCIEEKSPNLLFSRLLLLFASTCCCCSALSSCSLDFDLISPSFFFVRLRRHYINIGLYIEIFFEGKNKQMMCKISLFFSSRWHRSSFSCLSWRIDGHDLSSCKSNSLFFLLFSHSTSSVSLTAMQIERFLSLSFIFPVRGERSDVKEEKHSIIDRLNNIVLDLISSDSLELVCGVMK